MRKNFQGGGNGKCIDPELGMFEKQKEWHTDRSGKMHKRDLMSQML